MQHANFLPAFINQIQDFISQGGYIILIFSTIIEGIPLIGMAIPGNTIITIGGFLAKLGSLNLYWVLIASATGALIGDYIGFSIGKYYGMSFIEKLRPYLFISDSHINKAKRLLSDHTGKSLIIGRFTPATRSLMPFLVGTTNTSYSSFWFFNITGGLLWVFSSVMIGYIFGSAYHVVSGYIGKILIIAIIATILFVWGYKFVNERFHIFRRYELFTLILNILALWIFSATLDKLLDNSFQLNFDVWVNLIMKNLTDGHTYLISIAQLVSNLGNGWIVINISLIISLYLIYKRKWRSSAVLILSIFLTSSLTGFLKALFMIPRPNYSITYILGPGLPSGHSSLSAALFFVIIYLFAPKIKSVMKREIFIVTCVSAIIAMGLSRLVLNVHWFSDVVAGWAVGLFVATGVVLFVRYISILLIKKNN